MHLDVGFSTETELKQFQDLLYEKSGQGVSFTGLLEAMATQNVEFTSAPYSRGYECSEISRK